METMPETRPTPAGKVVERLLRHLEEKPAWSEPVDRPKLVPLLEIVREHAELHRLLSIVVERNVVFQPFDFLMYPDVLLLGKAEDAASPRGKVIASHDLVIAKNSAGDFWAFDARSGDIRRHWREEGYRENGRYGTLQSFLRREMEIVVERVTEWHLEEPSDDYLGDLRVALDIAGDDWLQEDVRPFAERLGVCGPLPE